MHKAIRRKRQRRRYKAFIADLEGLQDHLGALNDLATAPVVLTPSRSPTIRDHLCSSLVAAQGWRSRRRADTATTRRRQGSSMSDQLKVALQHLLPKQRLTTLAGRVAGAQAGALTARLIRWFVARYGVDMSEAANPEIASYATFNDFFTRPLRAGARPWARADFVCPVDGAISQFGAIDDHQILQAKGHRFTTTELIGGDAALAAEFRHGSFANLYLSPRDYHRLHMPCDGRLT
ncbi:MAG: phosphatidylserine decarboxylase, partial [Novosphingobium sp.]